MHSFTMPGTDAFPQHELSCAFDRYHLGDRPPLPSRNFQNHWDYHCRSAWHQAIYMFTAGLPRISASARPDEAVSAWHGALLFPYYQS